MMKKIHQGRMTTMAMKLMETAMKTMMKSWIKTCKIKLKKLKRTLKIQAIIILV